MATTSSKERLEKIRINFLFDHPFLSVLALSLPQVLRENPHEVFETNGLVVYIDEKKSELYSDATLKYRLAHVLLHILLKHPFRMQHRDPKTWNRSCDIAIDLLLEQFERVGERPPDEVLLQKFEDQSVEAIYAALYQENPESDDGEEADDQADKRDLIEQEGDTQELEAEINALIIQAVTAAKKAGNIPSSLVELISEITTPKVDLQTLLHAYMSESFFDKVSDFSRPNRRFIHQGLYLPGYKKEHDRLALTIALDRSMSISREVFSHFLGIINTVLSMGSDYTVTVLPFDESIDESMIVTYDASTPTKEVAFSKGNGGTDFSCVTKYLAKSARSWESNVLLVLSDGLFTIKTPPDMPMLFLISQGENVKRFRPYGDVIRFDL